MNWPFDPTTCRSLRARGGLVSEEAGEPSATKEGTSDATGEVAAANVYARYRAYIHSWWEDPPQKDVSKVENTIEWTPDGSCTSASGTSPSIRWRLYWFVETDWSVQSHDFTPTNTCCKVESASDATFRNDGSCETLTGPFDVDTTRTRHSQRITGRPDGDATFVLAMFKSGGCSFLLSSDFEQRRERAF